MIIDAHVHLRVPVTGSAEKSLEEGVKQFSRVIDIASDAGIDRLGVTGENPKRLSHPSQAGTGLNGLLMRLLKEFPKKLFGYARIDPNDPREAVREMEECFKEKRVVGVKVGGTKGKGSRKASAPVYDPIMKKLIELDGIMLMHAWYKTTGNYPQESTPFEVAEMASKFPEVKIQMAHLHGANYRGILAIAPYENILVDVSGSFPEAGFLEWAVDVLGPERIVFGSDVPGRDFSVQLAKVTGADLDEEVKAMILSGNMEEILKERSAF